MKQKLNKEIEDLNNIINQQDLQTYTEHATQQEPYTHSYQMHMMILKNKPDVRPQNKFQYILKIKIIQRIFSYLNKKLGNSQISGNKTMHS